MKLRHIHHLAVLTVGVLALGACDEEGASSAFEPADGPSVSVPDAAASDTDEAGTAEVIIEVDPMIDQADDDDRVNVQPISFLNGWPNCPLGTTATADARADIAAGGNKVVYYYPYRKGTHRIQFINASNENNAGTMASAWNSNASPSWSTWATSDVFSYYRVQTLTSGSSDVNYRFTFHNSKNVTRTFYWRFCTD